MNQPVQQSIDGQMIDTLPPAKEWIERWYGSEPYKGWAIMAGREEIAVLGDYPISDKVSTIVYRHNQDLKVLRAAIAATQVVADQPVAYSATVMLRDEVVNRILTREPIPQSQIDDAAQVGYVYTVTPLFAISNAGKASSEKKKLEIGDPETGYCKSCDGSGEGVGMSGGGPDAYEIPINCQTCGGTGAAPASSEPAVAAIEAVPSEAISLLKRLKRDLMHARRFSPDTLSTYRSACTNAEGDIEEFLAFTPAITPEAK